MAETITADYLAHPFTTETFDRTTDQRKERTQVVAQVRDGNPGMRGDAVELNVNRIMFIRFAGAIDTELEERLRARVGEEVKKGPCVDVDVLRTDERRKLLGELTVVHEVMPLPGMERLAEISSEALEELVGREETNN